MDMLSKKGFKVWRTGNSPKIQERHNGGDGQWRSADERGSLGICSRSSSLRDCAELLEDTLPVMTSGNFCEEHGCTYEWASGQNPHLMNDGKKIQYKNENFVPVVVPGLSSSSSSSSSSTSFPQDSSSSLNPPNSRRNEGAPGNSLQNLPEWLEDSTDNLEDSDVPALASISHDSGSEPPRKAAPKKHGIHTHFLKDRNSEVCKRTRMTRAPCRMRNGEEAVPRAEFFGDLTTAEQKGVNEGSESRDNDRCAVVVQHLATQWIQSYPCKKQKLLRKHKGGCKSSWS